MRSRSRFRSGWTDRLTSAGSPGAPGQPAPPDVEFSLGYRPSLDGLRAVRIYFGLDTRFDELLIGCVVGALASWGLLAPSRRGTSRIGAGAAAAASLLALLLWGAGWKEAVMLEGGLTAAAAGVLIADVIARPSGWLASALAHQPLVGIGRISYGLYLWHFPIVYGCGALAVDGTPPDLPRAALAIGLTFLVAVALFRWVERPMLQLKRRFTP